MHTAIIIHGRPDEEEYFDDKFDSPSNSFWIPWIQHKLLINKIFAQTPEMPTPYNPNYNEWKKEFERFDINENTILVGHSRGGGFIIRWLSENNIKVDKVALVAPSLISEVGSDFYNFNLDKNMLSKANNFKIFYSRDDEEEITLSVENLIKEIPEIESHIKYFDNMGHFDSDMGTREFPELLEFLIS